MSPGLRPSRCPMTALAFDLGSMVLCPFLLNVFYGKKGITFIHHRWILHIHNLPTILQLAIEGAPGYFSWKVKWRISKIKLKKKKIGIGKERAIRFAYANAYNQIELSANCRRVVIQVFIIIIIL